MKTPLRAFREAQGLTLREVARRAAVDAGLLSRVERGQARPSLGALWRIARVLGLKDLERLLEPYAAPGGPEG
jgi:transcriptional regulator with XRE-family HTH domain